MSDDSMPLNDGVLKNQALKSVPFRNISLSSIGPSCWFICDFAIAFVAAAIACALTPYELQQEAVKGEHVGRFAFCFGTGLLVALIGHISGLHETNQGRASLKFLGRCAVVSGLAVLVLNVELLFVHYQIVGRLITVFTVIGCTVGLFAVRALVFGLVLRNEYIVGFVGSEKFTAMASRCANLDSSQGHKTTALTLKQENSNEILSWALANHVNQIVIHPTDPVSPSQRDILNLMNSGITVSSYSNFVERLNRRIPSEHISAQWVIECQEEHAVLYKMALKRALDIFIAGAALVLLFPFGLIAAVCVKLDSPGPVIFQQTRVGQFGRSFTMLKFRTMMHGAEKGGAQWASESDSRITPVGQFLRRSRLDELPQLFNVLAGEMSLVGPRPERPEFTSTLEASIPYFEYRILVKPGITGWAQINAGYAATEAEAANKLSYDLYYIKNLSLGLDVRVLLRTISSFANGSR